MKKKKGFTLVELLVVIAILAILATVSVIGYIGFTDKAKESNDVSLTTQMNTVLQGNIVTEGKNETLYSAREDLFKAGIDIEKISPTSNGYSYVWDSISDQIILLDGSKNIVAPENVKLAENRITIFSIIHSSLELDSWKGYSYYLAADYVGDAVTLTSLTGVDTGSSTVKNVSITDATTEAEIIVRTNYGTLTIDAPKATVNHYGILENADLKAVAKESYHENGEVIGNIVVTKGRVELNSTAKVNTIVVSSAAANDVKIDVVQGAEINAVAASTEEAKVDISSSTSIPADSKVEGVIEPNDDYIGGLGTEKSPYLISELNQFSSLASGYYKLANNISFEKADGSYENYCSITTNVTLDLNGKSIKAYNGAALRVSLTGELTINDSVGTGRIYSETTYKEGYPYGIIDVNGKFIFNGGTISAVYSNDPNDAQYGITFGTGSNIEIVINGGLIEAGWYAISGNGNYDNKTTLTVNGGKLVSTMDYAIYNPQGGTGENASIVNINGGEVLGYAGAVAMNDGILNINGGTLTSKGTGYTGNWGDGTGKTSNSALALTAGYGKVTVNYTAGAIISEANAKDLSLSNEKSFKGVQMNSKFYELYGDLVDTTIYTVVNNADGTYTISLKTA